MGCLDSLKRQISENEDNISCILLEILKFKEPSKEFISEINLLRKKHGIIVIADENINCMKFGIKGAHDYFKVNADLVCYGKAIANGFSFSMLAGSEELMNLGGIKNNSKKVFLLSQTHSSESTGIAAALATCKKYVKKNVSKHILEIGNYLQINVNNRLNGTTLGQYLSMGGLPQNPSWEIEGLNNLEKSQLRAWLVDQFLEQKF